MAEPISIILTLEAQQVVESYQAIAQAAAEAYEQAAVSAMEKAERKLNDVTTAVKVNTAAVELNKQKIEELQAQQQNATQAIKANLDQEISGLQRLNEARQADNFRLEEKRIKLQASMDVANASSESEKLGIGLVTQSRLIELKAIEDQIKAARSVQDVSVEAAERQKQKLDELTQKQSQITAVIDSHKARIADLSAAKGSAAASDQERIDAEIAGIEKVIIAKENDLNQIEIKKQKEQEAGQLAQASSDAEVASIKQATGETIAGITSVQEQKAAATAAHQAEARAIQQVADAAARSADSQRTKIDDLNRKESQTIQIIDAHKQKIIELTAAKAEASGEDAARIEREIANIQKLIAARETELAKIDVKRLKEQETLQVSQAGSEAEIEAIRKSTTERTAGISALSDQKGAQEGVNQSTNEGAGALSKFFGMFSLVGTAMFALNQIKAVLEDNKRIMDEIVASGEKLRSGSETEYDKAKPFFSEAGLNTADEQKEGQAVLNKMVGDQNVQKNVIAQTAAKMAAPLKQAGITDIHSERFQGLVGNAARFVDRGVDATALSDFTTDSLKQDSKLTGEGLNQKLSNLMQVVHGSPERLNDMLRVFQEDKSRFTAAGFGQDDVTKFFSAAQDQGISAHEIPRLARQYFNGLNRLKGLSKEQRQQLHAELQDFEPQMKKRLELLHKSRTPEQMIHEQEQLRSGGVPELDAALEAEEVNPREVARILSTLPADKRDRAARAIAGSREAAPVGQAAGFDKVVLPTGAAQVPVSDSPDQSAKVQKDLADAVSAEKHPNDPFAERFQKDIQKEMLEIKRNPEKWQTFTDKHNFLWQGADPKQLAAGHVYMRELIRIARRQQDINAGTASVTPAQQKSMDDDKEQLIQRLEVNSEAQSAQVRALANPNGQYTDMDRWGRHFTVKADDVLKHSDDEIIQKYMNHSSLKDVWDNGIIDDRVASPILKKSAADMRSVDSGSHPATQPTTGPSTQPSTRPTTGPVAITNHYNRIVNYSTPHDSLGAPMSSDNRYS